MVDFTWVVDRESMAELAQMLETEPWHALDSESDSGFAYAERLCLLQLNVGDRLWLVDLMAFQGQEGFVEPLRSAFESQEKRTYLHGGEFDVGCFKRDFNIGLSGVWDSQQAASFLGWPKTGYGVVVERLCGQHLEKAFSLYDWSKRPIDPAALRYALDDVVYLPRVAQQLEIEIAQADLEEEVAIANQMVMDSVWSGGFDRAAFWRIKGVRKLPQEFLGRLMALYLARDQIAHQEDRPPGRILNDQAMISLVSRDPVNRRELRRCGLRAWFLERYEEDVLEALQRGRQDPPELPPPPKGRAVDPQERKRESRLKAWRRREAERRGVPFQVVLPSRSLVHLKRFPDEDLVAVPQMGDKRIRLYGEQIRGLLES